MADPIAIAERAQLKSVWGPCAGCQASRRLDDERLCYKCKMDPLRSELARLRNGAEVVRLNRELRERDAQIQRLKYRNKETLRRMRALRDALSAYFVLPLTESQYLALVAIMIDVVADDPDETACAIHGKLTRNE